MKKQHCHRRFCAAQNKLRAQKSPQRRRSQRLVCLVSCERFPRQDAFLHTWLRPHSCCDSPRLNSRQGSGPEGEGAERRDVGAGGRGSSGEDVGGLSAALQSLASLISQQRVPKQTEVLLLRLKPTPSTPSTRTAALPLATSTRRS